MPPERHAARSGHRDPVKLVCRSRRHGDIDLGRLDRGIDLDFHLAVIVPDRAKRRLNPLTIGIRPAAQPDRARRRLLVQAEQGGGALKQVAERTVLHAGQGNLIRRLLRRNRQDYHAANNEKCGKTGDAAGKTDTPPVTDADRGAELGEGRNSGVVSVRAVRWQT